MKNKQKFGLNQQTKWLMTVVTAALRHVTVFIQLNAVANSVSLTVLFINCMQLVFAHKHAFTSCWTLHSNKLHNADIHLYTDVENN